MSLKIHKELSIQAMLEQEIPIREIARTLKVSRSMIRRVKRKKKPHQREEEPSLDLDLIRRLYQSCRGNAVRMREILEVDHQMKVAYSTLTRFVREAHLREPKQRVGHYTFEPGEEMQHDTSPHRLVVGGKTVMAQCASLVLTYSRKLYIQYYPCFTRFEARNFLHKAIHFMSGAAYRCVIDNTSVILAAGSGSSAVFAPEMEIFGRCFQFDFFAHAVGHSDRKPHVERNFSYVENNFLAGRTFSSWDDLNEQAVNWCRQIANAKEKRSLGMCPEAAWLMEQPYLRPLPKVDLPLYKVFHRIVDTYGYVNLDTNRYSVPDRLLGKQVEVHKHLHRVCIYHGGRKVADHHRLVDQREGHIVTSGHHQPLVRKQKQACTQERKLKDATPDLDAYVSALKKRVRGRGVSQFTRLLGFKRTYPEYAFNAAIKHALHYGLFDLNRLETIILKRIGGDFFLFGEEDEQ